MTAGKIRGLDFNYRGEIGHKLAEALLLRYLTLARPEPDPGFDAVGHLRTQALGDRVCFNFQFKTGDGFDRCDASTVSKWISVLESEPVFLLHIESVSLEEQRYRFLVLHKWILRHPGWATKLGQTTISFNLREFEFVEHDGANFAAALEDERKRIQKEPTLWRSTRSLLVPISELDLFRNFGRLGKIEVSLPVLDEAKVQVGVAFEPDIWKFLQAWWSLPAARRSEAEKLPAIRQWLRTAELPVLPEAMRRERREFQRFVAFMEAADDNAALLPGFTYDEVSCWRVFVQLFPQSMERLLKACGQQIKICSDNQLMGLSQLGSTFACSPDELQQSGGRRILYALKTRVGIAGRLFAYRKYRVVRQLYYTACEAGVVDPSCAVDFLRRHPLDWELRLNREYYKTSTDDAMIGSTSAKIVRPRSRDVATLEISNFTLGRFPKERVKKALAAFSRRA